MHRILAINPGSTSTKIAVYEDDDLVFEEVIRYRPEELTVFETVMGQYRKRIEDIFEIPDTTGLPGVGFHSDNRQGRLAKTDRKWGL